MKTIGSIIILISLIFNAPAKAQEWRKDIPQAQLLGSGEFTWWGLSIYTAKLWHGQNSFNVDDDFALELTYHKNISRDRFVDASIDEIKRLQGSKLTPEQLQLWRSYMQKSFVDVKPGDQLIGVKLAKRGCRFYSREKLISEINDEAFAQAFFSIWLDPRSKDQDLRARILGKAK
ncbi:chalcone isomerase family protein [Undibacterium nitidum]|uniref:chalcone isomerase family protein n=1 Tax=Undibacterium TaxID=401469 RepID=UPI001C9B73E9|nr:chalcone isomerase family protein [Undibacterium nitidum]